MGGFTLPNLTLGGGSNFSAILAQLLGELGQQRNVRAGIGSDLYSNLLNTSLEANRSPINLVDRLMLSGEVGSPFALSQASQEQLGRYTSRPQGDLLSDLQRRLNLFTVGALTPTQQVAEGFNPNTGVELTPKESEYIRIAGMSPDERTQDAVRRGVNPQTGAPLTEEERAYISAIGQTGTQGAQFGGTVTVDPKKKKSTMTTLAGPATITDSRGIPKITTGEKDEEQIRIEPTGPQPQPMPTFGPETTQQTAATSPSTTSTTPGSYLLNLTQSLPADVRYRFQAITDARPDLPEDIRLSIARSPGGFEAYTGVQTDPRTAAARLVGGALAGDTRFSPSLIQSLSLGRAPSPAQLTARDFAQMPPDVQESLLSVIGPDLARQFLYELQGFTPRGTRTRIAGPVAA